MITGKVSGIFVLDIDDVAKFEEWARQANKEPRFDTLTQRSQSGGLHYFFKWEARLGILKTTQNSLPGTDVRSTGGMVFVSPSSIVASDTKKITRYTWIDDSVSPKVMPDWLFEELSSRNAKKTTIPTKEAVDQAVDQEPIEFDATSRGIIEAFVQASYSVASGGVRNVTVKKNESNFNYIAVELRTTQCPFKTTAHKNNHPYILIHKLGSKMKCHDGATPCVKSEHNAIPYSDLPEDIQAIVARFCDSEEDLERNSKTQMQMIVGDMKSRGMLDNAPEIECVQKYPGVVLV